ncbi:MAG: hypothetical protein SVM80_11710 [Halobacteriota archaeon]|nr:hypothetical protein [Halobacteriota archaeon]
MEWGKSWSGVACFGLEDVNLLLDSVMKEQGFVFRSRIEDRFWTTHYLFDILSPIELEIKVYDYYVPGTSHDVSKISIKTVDQKTESYINQLIIGFVNRCPRKPWEFEKGTTKEKIDYLKRNWKKTLLLFIPIIIVLFAFFSSEGHLADLIDDLWLMIIAILSPLFFGRGSNSKKAWERWLK